MYKMKKRFCSMFLVWMFLASQVFGVDIVWIGNAQDIAQVDLITVTGTWTSAETLTVTCNSKSVIVTMGTTIDTVAEVAAAVAEALGLLNHDENNFTADMTINVGGREFGEFYDFEAVADGAVITITSEVLGTPFTITVAETSAAGGITHSACRKSA